MTQTESQVIDAQVLGASFSDSAEPVTFAGEPHTAARIMFVHGLVTGHVVCTCPVGNEHGYNVNPGRAPLDGKALGRAEGSRKASETYARRRARKAADELAVIDPSLWDDETRRIVTTLATVAPASRIDELLAGELPVTLDELDALVAKLDTYPPCGEQQRPRPEPYPQPRPREDPDTRPAPVPHPRPQPQRVCLDPDCNCRRDRRWSVVRGRAR